MITRVALENFQSWESLDLELAPTTVIVGRGNSGKSAILRAIRYALTNKSGDGFIREGAKSCYVRLELSSGAEVEWAKFRGVGGTYTLTLPDGERREYSKTAGVVPADIVEATGVRPTEIDKTLTLLTQFHSQHDTPFILGETGSRTARILGKLTRLDVLGTAQAACRKETRQRQDAMKAAEEQARDAEERLAQLPALDLLREEYDDAQKTLQKERSEGDTLAALAPVVQAYEQAATRAALRISLARLAEELATLFTDGDRHERASRLVADYDRAVASRAALQLQADNQRQLLELAREEYEAECKAKGVCDSCPWK